MIILHAEYFRLPFTVATDNIRGVNAASLEAWCQGNIILSPLAALPSISWPVTMAVVVIVLLAACIAFAHLRHYLAKQGILQPGRSVFSRERELSLSFLPPALEKLHDKAHERFWNLAGQPGTDDVSGAFMHAVNLIDTADQFVSYPEDSSNHPTEGINQGGHEFGILPLQSTVGLEDGMTYLLFLRRCRSGIIHYKILYEYQRKNGSLKYWLYDRKPLLAMADIMRRLLDEERGAFFKACQEFDETQTIKHHELLGQSEPSKLRV